MNVRPSNPSKATEKTLIGQAEKVKLPFFGGEVLHARIDTGARTSAIWATDVKETDAGLEVRLADSSYDVNRHAHIFKHYDRVVISSSTGHKQIRYRIKMSIVIKGRRILTTFTLADRQTQVYPILIGRNTLMNKFVVDVTKGSRLRQKEAEKIAKLQELISEDHV